MKTNDSNTVMTESTAVKSNIEKKDGLSPLWQSVLVGGVPGILIGAGSTIGVEAIASSSPTEEDVEALNESLSTGSSTGIMEAHSVNDDMSFSEAFASARNEVGAGGAFVWHGQVYGTYRGDDPEWIEMTDEDRTAHSQEILSQVHARPYTPTLDEPETVPAPQVRSEAHDAPVADEDEYVEDIDVHILGVGELPTPYGTVQAGVGVLDDHQAVFADTDGDDMVDTVLIDINDNGQLDRGEVFDATGADITMDSLRESVEPMDPSITDSMDDAQDMGYGDGVTSYV